VLSARRWLRAHSALGDYGPDAIRRYLQAQALDRLPARRTIARLLARHGLTDRRRSSRPPPPPGWYLPELAHADVELDQLDWIEGLSLQAGSDADVLTCLSLSGHLAGVWVGPGVRTAAVLTALTRHWQHHGCPHFAQFDNATCFASRTHHPGWLGRVVHFCLCAGVVPVFVPPRETGFQAAVEGFNGLWQERVWRRWRHPSRAALARRSDAFVTAHQQRHAARISAAPARRALGMPVGHTIQQTRVVLLRRTDGEGRVSLLEQTRVVDADWTHRLVRCEVDVKDGTVAFHGLRRAAPLQQPLLSKGLLQVRLSPWKGAKD
jgi:hypothetical protein